ncbi:MAG TPA: PA14 domain-containing protein [Ardenticatenaceae bacterium]|nr:PA14 domain-containing protein [Ardenticatenaceae bacterium]
MATKHRFIRILVGVILALIVLAPSLPAPAMAAETGWRAEYYSNPYLAGSPQLVRDESLVSYNWEWGAPAWGLPADGFSARWTRQTYFNAGRYRFTTVSDDGVRLWVNNTLLIDQWNDHPAATHSAEITLPAAYHYVRLEYYENRDRATIQVSWAPVATQAQGWYGEYFANRHLSGSPALVRSDADINFDWQTGSPDRAIPRDNFSVRWTRALRFAPGRYEFTTRSDDGVRLYVDDRLVIDRWQTMASQEVRQEVQLSEGVHTVRLEYFEGDGGAAVRLRWRGPILGSEMGNIITCVPPYPSYSWIKVYRLEADGTWRDMNPHGYPSIEGTGYLAIPGMPVDVGVYGEAGHPYRVEQWIEGSLARSVGNTARGEPAFRVFAGRDTPTPWQCPRY